MKGHPVERGEGTFGLIASVNFERVYPPFPETRVGRGRGEITFKALASLGRGG